MGHDISLRRSQKLVIVLFQPTSANALSIKRFFFLASSLIPSCFVSFPETVSSFWTDWKKPSSPAACRRCQKLLESGVEKHYWIENNLEESGHSAVLFAGSDSE
jgi:hypothetical protein